MIRRVSQHGKIQYWALILSVAAHSATLAVFTGVKMSGGVSKDQPVKRSAMNVQMIEQVIAQPTPKPKPRIEPIVTPSPPEKQPTQPPLISESEPPQPVVAEAEPTKVEPEIVNPVVEPAVNEVKFFGRKSIVQRVCYVVDCSGSMYGRMYQVRDQLKRSILNLNSQQAFSIVFFMEGQTLKATGNGKLQQATAPAKSKALQLIESVRPSGSTDAAHALRWAMKLRDDSGKGAELIYFLSDGFDLDPDSSTRFVNQLQSLRASLVPNAALHTIGFGSQPQDRQMLLSLAHSTGGEFIEVK